MAQGYVFQRAEGAWWQLLVGAILLYLSFQTLRAGALLWCGAPLNDHQADDMRRMIKAHPEIVRAAGHWMVEGETLRQCDWRLARRAQLALLTPPPRKPQDKDTQDLCNEAQDLGRQIDAELAKLPAGKTAEALLPAGMNDKERKRALRALAKLQTSTAFRPLALPLADAARVQRMRSYDTMRGWTRGGPIVDRVLGLVLWAALGMLWGAPVALLAVMAGWTQRAAVPATVLVLGIFLLFALLSLAFHGRILWKSWTATPIVQGTLTTSPLYQLFSRHSIAVVFSQHRRVGEWITPRQASRLARAALPFMAYEKRYELERASAQVVQAMSEQVEMQHSQSLKQGYDLDQNTLHPKSVSTTRSRRL